MILVIADDFSGACELANIAVNHGFSAEVATDLPRDLSAEVIALDTNSRNCDPQTAIAKVTHFLKQIPRDRVKWIYKKTDSVFRGNPIAEIDTVMSTFGYRDCCFVPANPSRGRIIERGLYFLNGQPLHLTEFGRDPHHAISTNVVRDLVGNCPKIRIPNVTTENEIPQIDSNTLAAGGADFFRKLLGQGITVTPKDTVLRSRILLVCGSLHAWRMGRAVEMSNLNFRIIEANEEFTDQDCDEDRLMLAIGKKIDYSIDQAMNLLIERAKRYLALHTSVYVLVEGGDTARAMVDSLAWKTLTLVRGRCNAIAHLRCPTRHLLCVKPGSYDWPAEIF